MGILDAIDEYTLTIYTYAYVRIEAMHTIAYYTYDTCPLTYLSPP